MLTTRATPQMYYGEEVGMRTTPPARKEEVHDPIGKIGWPKEKGRDGERTPMQWDATRNAGFSTAQKTWLPVPPSAQQYNVAVELQKPDSILNFYKKLLVLRQSEPALRDGSYLALNREDANVLSFLRKNPASGVSILVALNMSAQAHTASFDLSSYGIQGKMVKPLLSTPNILAKEVPLNEIKLPAFGVLIAAVQ